MTGGGRGQKSQNIGDVIHGNLFSRNFSTSNNYRLPDNSFVCFFTFQVESELIDKLDILVSENKGDEDYKHLFNSM